MVCWVLPASHPVRSRPAPVNIRSRSRCLDTKRFCGRLRWPMVLIVRIVRPEDFEMPLEGFHTWITPTEHFFVRSHMSRPSVDVASWRLNVQGEVSSPLNLTMDDLKKFPVVEVVGVLECAGN